MKLTNPTEYELNDAFAEKVAGWYRENGIWFSIRDDGLKVFEGETARFTDRADKVLPWLEKWPKHWQAGNVNAGGPPIWVSLGDKDNASVADTIAHAAVIALLRAHGVDVEFK